MTVNTTKAAIATTCSALWDCLAETTCCMKRYTALAYQAFHVDYGDKLQLCEAASPQCSLFSKKAKKKSSLFVFLKIENML